MTEILPVQADDVAQSQAHHHHNSVPTSTNHASHAPFSKRVILDKDGKPCRTCNTFRDWVSATKQLNPNDAPPNPPPGSPPDVEDIGRASWTLLHSLAATYPRQASEKEQQQMQTFMSIFARVYPCWSCAEGFGMWMRRDENHIERYLGGRKEFGDWLCRAHNDVNRRLGKDEFDCRKWMERWGGDE